MQTTPTDSQRKALFTAINKSDVETVRQLLSININPNVFEQHRSALISAAIAGNFEIFEMLIVKGADVNTKKNFAPIPGYPASGIGALKYGIEINWGEPNPTDKKSGVTPLHLAVLKADNKILETLLKNGANVEGCGLGETPLELAIDFDKLRTSTSSHELTGSRYEENLENIMLLIKFGAKLAKPTTLENSDKATAILNFAEQFDKISIPREYFREAYDNDALRISISEGLIQTEAEFLKVSKSKPTIPQKLDCRV